MGGGRKNHLPKLGFNSTPTASSTVSQIFPPGRFCVFIIIIIIIYPLTTSVVEAPRWFCNQFSPFFHVLHCPLGPAKLQACLFPDVVFPPLPLPALSSSSSHCTLQDGFCHTWWTGDMTIPLQFGSLYNRQEVFMWSNCLLAQTSPLVIRSLYEMCNILR